MYNTLNKAVIKYKAVIKSNNQIVAEEQISSNVEFSELVDKQSQPKRKKTQEENNKLHKRINKKVS